MFIYWYFIYFFINGYGLIFIVLNLDKFNNVMCKVDF